MKQSNESLTGWGRWRWSPATVVTPTCRSELEQEQLSADNLIVRGLGRSYGDAAQRDSGNAVVTTACNVIDWHDRATGVIRADAGVSIGQIISRFAPKGWFVPVTPGTRNVTVGGAIAADIHGKNHHRDGSFGAHVISMRLRLANDEIIRVSPAVNGELFWATVGGMGLTGIVVDAVIQLTPIASTTIEVETQRLSSLTDLMDEMRRSDALHAFSVAWVDLLQGQRSVLTQGSFAAQAVGPAGNHRRPWTSAVGLPPVPLPRVAITPGVRAFNELWWRKAPAAPTTTGESITAFFHPLDAISDWNRVYGRTGFVQWQCVVPDSHDATLLDLADRLTALPSYFTVLKRFGPANQGPLSFPVPGWTLAVDLPATAAVISALPALDRAVANAGGRIYLAKDARMSRESFESMYPRLEEFKAIRRSVDPDGRFASDLAARLGLC